MMTKKDRWFTPTYIIEEVHESLGDLGICYDLASEELANQNIKAGYFFSQGNTLEDFFSKEGNRDCHLNNWWLNPPFSKVDYFVDLVINLLRSDSLGTGFVLVNSNTETKYYQKLLNNFPYFILLNKRIPFIDPQKGSLSGNPKGQTIFTNQSLERLDNWKKLGTICMGNL